MSVENEHIGQIKIIFNKVVPKLTKTSVLYTDSPPPESPFFPTYACSACIHYLKDTNRCILVEGEIQPTSWCLLWLANIANLGLGVFKLIKMP